MYLEASQIFQLSLGLIGAILILVAAYGLPLKLSVGILLFMIPFQPIETRFGSVNILMTYVLFGALMLRGRLRYMPMLGAMLLVLFAYLLSISQLHQALYFYHGLHVFFIVSGLLVFVLAYNMAREVENPRYIINFLIAANVVSVLYCLLQFSVGPGEKMFLFGNQDLWMHRNRGGGDPRLVGPFGTPGITAAYFMSMTVLLAYEILYSRSYRRIALVLLVAANVAMMMATANRGSFLVLLASLLGFLYVFRERLGIMRVIYIAAASFVLTVGAASYVATHTEFGDMFSRLETVGEFQGGLPNTRQHVWPQAWAAMQDELWLGHGPWLQTPRAMEKGAITVHPEQLTMEYPHNLYMHLVLTLGLVGATCMLYFLFSITWRTYRGARVGQYDDDYERGLVVLGVLLAVGFFVDQIKIEFVRHDTIDYVHFVFALFGIFLGLGDRARVRASEPMTSSSDPEERRNDIPIGSVSRSRLRRMSVSYGSTSTSQ
jgi:O-antigen ligase